MRAWINGAKKVFERWLKNERVPNKKSAPAHTGTLLSNYYIITQILDTGS
jgi:hypothetical protein